MAQLPTSIFSTPGMRAHGDAGTVVDDVSKVAGCRIAYVARTADIARMRPPCFGFLTTVNRKVGGAKPVRCAAFIRQIIHIPARPDIVALRHDWLIDKPDFKIYYPRWKDILACDKKSRAVFNAMGPDDLIIDFNFAGLSGLLLYEPSIKVLRVGEPNDDNDRDAVTAAVVMRKEPYKKAGWLRLYAITALTGKAQWEMSDLLEVLPDTTPKPPAIEPPPPSGMLPLVPSFESVPRDVMYINDTIYRISAAPGKPVHGAEYILNGEHKFGVLLGRVAPGEPIPVRELLTREQLALRLSDAGAPPVHEAWALDDDELVLGPAELDVPCEAVRRPILLLPSAAHMLAKLDAASAARQLNLVLRADNKLSAISEPLTNDAARAELAALHLAIAPTANENISLLLRNETRFQVTPENQTNLAYARVDMAMDHSTFLAIPHACKAEWTGDREHTYEYYFKDAAELADLWGGVSDPPPPNGWVVPEKPNAVGGAKRRRAARQRGYMCIMTHADEDGKGANKMTYCTERKAFHLYLAAAFWGENLKFIRGAPPPEAPPSGGEFDLVDEVYVERSNAAAWTAARARAHFGEW